MKTFLEIMMNISRTLNASKMISSLDQSEDDEPVNLNENASASNETSISDPLNAPSAKLFIGFNEDHQCFFSGTESGFTIYNSNPYMERFHRELDGGIGIVELLGKSNIVALVGGGNNPKYSPAHVMIWDDYQNMPIAKLEYNTEVKAIRCRGQRILVVLTNRVLLYNFADLKLVAQYETTPNLNGLCSMISNSNSTIIGIPGCKPGDLRIEIIIHPAGRASDQMDTKRSFAINAHQTSLSNISMSMDGKLCATTSEKGTLIRIWNCEDGSLNRELRRGIEHANILSLNFKPNGDGICLSSDKGTIHIYSLVDKTKAKEEHEKNKKSSLSFMKRYLPDYFSSEWSQTNFSVPHSKRSICAFTPDDNNTIMILTENGRYYKYRYLPGEDLVQLVATEKF